jgi:hypothetical protein
VFGVEGDATSSLERAEKSPGRTKQESTRKKKERKQQRGAE